jgi:hypothetical protein
MNYFHESGIRGSKIVDRHVLESLLCVADTCSWLAPGHNVTHRVEDEFRDLPGADEKGKCICFDRSHQHELQNSTSIAIFPKLFHVLPTTVHTRKGVYTMDYTMDDTDSLDYTL